MKQKANKIQLLKILFLTGLFISPFVYSPNSLIQYELPKVVFVRIWISVLLTSGLIFWKNRLDRKKDKILFNSILVFSCIVILSSFFGSDFSKSWLGNYYRGDGIFTFLHFIGLVVFLIYFLEKSWIEGFLKIIGATSVVLSLLSILTWVLINLFGQYQIEIWVDNGIGLFFGNPNFLVGYLLLSLPSFLYLFKEKIEGKILLKMLIWVIVFAGIFLTKAWAGILGVFIFLLLWLLMSKNKYKLIVGSVLAISVIVGFIVGNRGNVISAESRQRIYTKAVLAFFEKPILGFGWANFDYAFKSINYPIFYQNDIYVDKAHSSILEMASTIGVFGLAIYLFIILRSLSNLFRQKEFIYKCLSMMLLITVVHMQINIVSISEEIIFWILAAISISYPKRITPKEETV